MQALTMHVSENGVKQTWTATQVFGDASSPD
jgi:hypothetical protein